MCSYAYKDKPIFEVESNNNRIENNFITQAQIDAELSEWSTDILIDKLIGNDILSIVDRMHPDFYKLSGIVEQGIMGVKNDATDDFFAFLVDNFTTSIKNEQFNKVYHIFKP